MPAEDPALAGATAHVLRERARTGDLWLDVDGDSMRPSLVAPARVLVRAATAPRPGEVWAFVADDGSIRVHRCVTAGGAGCHRFRGDASAHEDPPVSPDRLVGRAVLVRDRRGERPVRVRRAVVAAWRLRRAVAGGRRR